MAADLPETDLVRVRRWCEQRIPAHAHHQVRLEHQTHGHTVTIVERRAPWKPGYCPEWTSRPVAQLRDSANGWRLYWGAEGFGPGSGARDYSCWSKGR
jgi:hypothetical protein